MSDSVLSIEDLHLSFPIFRGDVHALNHVSLEIGRGEIVGVVGESGSGKSVTAMLAMRLLPEGSYHVHHGRVTLARGRCPERVGKTASSVARRQGGDDFSGADDGA